MDFIDGYGLILIDGQRIMGCCQSGGMGEYGTGLNQIPIDLIERVEVVKGPSSALYGSDAVAGVTNIITKKSQRRPPAMPVQPMVGTRSKKKLLLTMVWDIALH